VSLITKLPYRFLAHIIEVKYIPSWLPGAGFKRKAKEYRVILEKFMDTPHEWVKSQIVLIQLSDAPID
jgi:hypothetical protein